MTAEQYPQPSEHDPEAEYVYTHRLHYRPDINEWWCYDCEDITDRCVEYLEGPEPPQ